MRQGQGKHSYVDPRGSPGAVERDRKQACLPQWHGLTGPTECSLGGLGVTVILAARYLFLKRIETGLDLVLQPDGIDLAAHLQGIRKGREWQHGLGKADRRIREDQGVQRAAGDAGSVRQDQQDALRQQRSAREATHGCGAIGQGSCR